VDGQRRLGVIAGRWFGNARGSRQTGLAPKYAQPPRELESPRPARWRLLGSLRGSDSCGMPPKLNKFSLGSPIRLFFSGFEAFRGGKQEVVKQHPLDRSRPFMAHCKPRFSSEDKMGDDGRGLLAAVIAIDTRGGLSDRSGSTAGIMSFLQRDARSSTRLYSPYQIGYFCVLAAFGRAQGSYQPI